MPHSTIEFDSESRSSCVTLHPLLTGTGDKEKDGWHLKELSCSCKQGAPGPKPEIMGETYGTFGLFAIFGLFD